jgi:hypothetical protein
VILRTNTASYIRAVTFIVCVLTSFDIESFVELGFCVLHAAFTSREAAVAVDCLWQRIEQKTPIRRSDPATWPESYDIEEQLPFPPVLACFSDSMAAAVEQLVGPGRWCGDRRWGFWPVNFSYGASSPWDYPTHGWHVDGNWFRHTIDCPKQGLLVVGLFTDIQPRWGGTILASGSHKRTARVLSNYPEGISHVDFSESLWEIFTKLLVTLAMLSSVIRFCSTVEDISMAVRLGSLAIPRPGFGGL